METQAKLGAKARGCEALENNEGSNTDAVKVEVAFGEFDETTLMLHNNTISLFFCYPYHCLL